MKSIFDRPEREDTRVLRRWRLSIASPPPADDLTGHIMKRESRPRRSRASAPAISCDHAHGAPRAAAVRVHGDVPLPLSAVEHRPRSAARDHRRVALAVEDIFAVFLGSGFPAVLLFGWDKVGRKLHFPAMCMVASGAHVSAIWIVAADSWMRPPAGHHIVIARNQPSKRAAFDAMTTGTPMSHAPS
jgi:hypothetical protein